MQFQSIILKKDQSNNVKRYYFIKRNFDIVISLMGLVLLSPIILFFSVLVYIESPGKVIFKQKRIGKNGSVFTLYKIRSMRLDAERNGEQWTQEKDTRILKIGTFIRRTKIDELPQLINVIKGEMTLVGPRPETPTLTFKFNDKYPGFVNRLSVTPGLTGLAQISGGYDLNPHEKLKKDLEYIGNQSLIMDIWIVLNTFLVVITGKGAR
ncbi:sugar transferase [Turicibacter sanguinis]|uniref:Sugar transferase n=1 Tax=Turicibacter sanguinis TaxID=154288 RepID=A0A9X4XFX4_9FIRM|nr:sugar transferase [Turicibacter sanguinis]MTK73950.1 sugar transferase [Turicibacter sanguinis]MTN46139.1 sugar transferase [Turicibacter sanguinis]MTN52272.1 sugar transferase [Turicibacter sanguinis]MTN55030.1 sugar transferase [Turicibacter sanguinis]